MWVGERSGCCFINKQFVITKTLHSIIYFIIIFCICFICSVVAFLVRYLLDDLLTNTNAMYLLFVCKAFIPYVAWFGLAQSAVTDED